MKPHLPCPTWSAKTTGMFATLLACVALPAYAESGFQGFNLGAQVSFMNASSELSFSDDDDGVFRYKMGAPSQTINLQAAYSLTLGEQTVLSIGGSYQPGITPAGSSPVGEGVPLDFELHGIRVFYVEPGYAIHPTTLVYGKFAYSTTKATLVINGGEEKLSTTLEGYGFGAGLRHLLTPFLYLQIEFLQLDYTKKSLTVPGEDDVSLPIKAGTTSANIGLGLQF